jgi:citrate lyase gamma subunit
MKTINISMSPAEAETRVRPASRNMIEISLISDGDKIVLEIPRTTLHDIIEDLRDIEEAEQVAVQDRLQMALFARMGEPL